MRPAAAKAAQGPPAAASVREQVLPERQRPAAEGVGVPEQQQPEAAGGGGRGGGGAAAPGGGGGAGAGGGGLDGRGPAPPGMKEKSSASEDEIHGTCSWREARVTPRRVRFSVSSAIRSGVRISLSSSRTNRL